MDLFEPEIEAEVFVWEAAASDVVESDEEAPDAETLVLRTVALEALDGLEETAPAEDDADERFAALNVEVHGAAVEPEPELVIESDPAPAVMADVAATTELNLQAVEAEQEADLSDDEYAAACLALLHEIYPDGIAELFTSGIGQGLFALVHGKGLISGNEEWIGSDDMLFDGIVMSLEESGFDFDEVWEDFSESLAAQLFPDGFSIANLYKAMDQNGPISGLAEWTELDFVAFDLAKEMVWSEDFDGKWLDGALELFNEAYPGGIADIFPDGYSDEAFFSMYDGKGLQSGQAEWAEADVFVFQGLWLALEEAGIAPFENESEFVPLPIVIDDGFAYPMPIVIDDGVPDPMPIVIDDGYFHPGEDGLPEMVACDLMPPPEMVVCFPQEVMLAI